MGFNRFTKNVLNISGLPDRVQNKAATLKALFDQAGVDIKDALNGLIAELEASTGASNIGANVPTVTTKTVQAILTAFEESILDRYTKGEINALVSGNTNNLVEDVDINLTTGVITVTKKDGTVEKYDTAIEKVPAKFEITQNGNTYYLKITNVDGTSTQTDITKLMNIYEFNNTNDIAFTVEGTGNQKTVKANIRANSIGLDKLSVSVVSTLEGYMNSAKDSANSAKSSENSARNSAETARKAAEVASEGIEAGKTAVKKATEAESYAHGGTGTRENEDRDNAKYYSQVAKEVAGGNFVTVTEMETYAQKKGTVPSFEGEVVSGEEIEVDVPVEVESILHISGNSEQDSRSGKNLLAQENFTTAQTINGVTFTPNADGSVKINGTATASTNLYLTYKLLDELITGKTYISSIGETGAGLRLIVEEAKGGSWVASISNNQNAPWAFNGLTTGDKVRVAINVPNGTTVNTTIYPQIEEGSTVTSYEPYGVKPSPEFESPIMSVKSKSDNLFDISKKTDNTEFIWSNGNDYAITGAIRSDYIPIGDIKSLSSNYWFNITFHDKNKAYLGNGAELVTTNQNAVTSIIIPNNSNIAYFRVAYKPSPTVKANPTDMTTVTDIMLNKGTVALPYQPYGYVPVEARAEGKNKIDLSKNPAYKYNVSVESLETGIRVKSTINGNSADSFYAVCIIDKATGYIGKTARLKSNCVSSSTNQSRFRIGLCAEDGSNRTILANSVSGSKEETLSTVIPELTGNQEYLCAIFSSTNGACNAGDYVDYTNVVLTIDDEDMTYTPYVEPKTISIPLGDIELRSTPDGTRDTFARVDGVWNKVEYNPLFQIPSTNDVRSKFQGNGLNSQGYIQYSVNILEQKSKSIRIISNRFESNDAFVQDSKVAKEMVYCRAPEFPNHIYMCIKADRLDGETYDLTTQLGRAEAMLAWLTKNPTYIVYPTTTPTYTPITDQGLISALDELEELILHKGYNHITVTAVNGVKAYLDLDIPATASVTNVVETDVPHELIIPAVTGEGDVKVKIPTENKMTINPATGEVNVKALKIDGVDITTFIEQVVAKLGN